MAMYKVPQDVEVADKILGPLSVKQFIFAILFVGSGYLDFLLFQAFIPLILLGLPFTVVFGVLAFYQRSDQPVEVYLMSAIRFYTKSRKRIWDQDGYEERVEITAPKTIEIQRTKGLTETEVKSSLSDLAKMMDTHGWASKNIDSLDAMGVSSGGRILNITDIQSIPDANAEELAQTNQQHDILDNNATSIARKFNNMVEQRAVQIRQQALAQVQQVQIPPQQATIVQPQAVQSQPVITQQPIVKPINPVVQARINALAQQNEQSVSSLSEQANEIAEGAELNLH